MARSAAARRRSCAHHAAAFSFLASMTSTTSLLETPRCYGGVESVCSPMAVLVVCRSRAADDRIALRMILY